MSASLEPALLCCISRCCELMNKPAALAIACIDDCSCLSSNITIQGKHVPSVTDSIANSVQSAESISTRPSISPYMHVIMKS